MKNTGFTTTSLNIPYAKKDPHNALQMPLYEAVAFDFESAEQMEANFKGEYIAHVYSRTSSPTLEYFELKLKALTNSHAVLGVSSGMAAISNAILAIVKEVKILFPIFSCLGTPTRFSNKHFLSAELKPALQISRFSLKLKNLSTKKPGLFILKQ
jgi:cystathionine beta-lyase/cystathionine gamma-synthase